MNLTDIFEPARDAQSAMVIGPRFEKGTPQSTIIQNYSAGIYMLALQRKLDANSPFVQHAQQVLSDQLQANSQIQVNPVSLSFMKEAKPGLETAIAHGLELALTESVAQ